MPETATLPPAFAPPGPAQTLLLVEDSRHAAEAVRLIARRLGLRLRRAETLAGARQHLRVYRPDVVLVDLGLPDGSGLELIAELSAARPRLRRVVALSADPEAGPEALAAGACVFVAKPLRLPADLPALLGPGLVAPGVLPGPEAGPNAGADPLALRDDLRHAREAVGQARLGYAVRFVQGLARCAGDDLLGRAAVAAQHSGQTAALLAALAAREQQGGRL
jgi:CheY-like chemotaxis protein